MAERNKRYFKCVKTDCFHLSFTSFKRYLNHLRSYHIHEPNFKVTCPVETCFRSYSLLSSLTSHIRRKHRGEVNFDNDLNDTLPQDVDCDPSCEDLSPLPCNGEEVDCDSHDISVKELALYALKTQEFNQLSDTATDGILENTRQLLEQNEENLKQKVKKCIQNNGIHVKDIPGLENLLEWRQYVAETMKQVKTSKERNKYLTNTLNMVVSSNQKVPKWNNLPYLHTTLVIGR